MLTLPGHHRKPQFTLVITPSSTCKCIVQLNNVNYVCVISLLKKKKKIVNLAETVRQWLSHCGPQRDCRGWVSDPGQELGRQREYDLCRGNKHEFADAIVLTFISPEMRVPKKV